MNKKRLYELIIPISEDEWTVNVWRITIGYTWRGVLFMIAVVLQLICAIDMLVKLIRLQ